MSNHVVPRRRRLALHPAACLAALLACGSAHSPQPPREPSITFIGAAAQAPAGAALASGAIARVTSPEGRALAGTPVEFRVRSGGGIILDTVVLTDATGHAATTWILGPLIGEQELAALAAGAEGRLTVEALRPAVGTVHEGRREYVVYHTGDLPIILGVPHGGLLRPDEIPDRTWGTTVRDRDTEELAHAISDALHERTGRRPHLVIVRLHRTKLDANRDFAEAAQDDLHAGRAWHEFHAFIDAARATVEREHGAGIYIDVHGHAHAIPRIELGYLISDANLRRTDAELDAGGFAEGSSIRALVQRSPHPLSAVLRGAPALGTRLEVRGYPAVPSASQPHAGGEPYFSGGPNVRRHGSQSAGTMDAFQLEAHYPGVRDSNANRVAFARVLADVLEQYLEEHLGLTLAAAAAASP